MPKPQHTFMVVKGKAKVVTDAEDSRKQSGQERSEQRINAADYLLEKARVHASDLPTGAKILEAAKKAAKDRIDETTLGKVKKVAEKLHDLAEQVLKLQGQEQKAVAELRRPATEIIRMPDLTPQIGLQVYVDALGVLILFLHILIKIHAKGRK